MSNNAQTLSHLTSCDGQPADSCNNQCQTAKYVWPAVSTSYSLITVNMLYKVEPSMHTMLCNSCFCMNDPNCQHTSLLLSGSITASSTFTDPCASSAYKQTWVHGQWPVQQSSALSAEHNASSGLCRCPNHHQSLLLHPGCRVRIRRVSWDCYTAALISNDQQHMHMPEHAHVAHPEPN